MQRQIGLCWLMLTVFAQRTTGQEVLAPVSAPPVVPPALQERELDRPGQLPATPPSAAWQAATPLQWGPVVVRPAVSYRFSYTDEVRATTNLTSSSYLNEMSPSVTLELGKHWAVGYGLNWRVYSDEDLDDTVDHSVTLSGSLPLRDWLLGLRHTSSFTESSTVETGGQTRQDNHGTALSAFHRFDDQWSCELTAMQDIQNTTGFNDMTEWTTMNWVDFQAHPAVALGAGGGLGYISADRGADQVYEQALGRVTWRASRKIRVMASGGVEFRQFHGNSAADDVVNPVVSGSVAYFLTELTTLRLNASHAVTTSPFQDQFTKTTGVSGGIRQRLLGRLFLDLDAAYSHVRYESSASATTVNRQDDVFSLDARLSTTVWKRGSAAVFYRRSEDSSNTPGFDVASNQVGLEFRYGY